MISYNIFISYELIDLSKGTAHWQMTIFLFWLKIFCDLLSFFNGVDVKKKVGLQGLLPSGDTITYKVTRWKINLVKYISN